MTVGNTLFPRPRRRWLGAAIIALVCLSTAPVAQAAVPRAYRLGLEAVERGDWQAAAGRFREAIAADPQAKRGALVVRKRYIPHYFLGLALYELGDCRGALAALATSEEQGVIVRMDEMATLGRMTATCGERVKGAERAADRARGTVVGGREIESRVDALSRDRHLLTTLEALQPQWQSASQELAAADRLLSRSLESLDLDGIDRAAADAGRATESLEAVETALLDKRGEIRARVAELSEERQQLVERALARLTAASDEIRAAPAWQSGRQCVLDQVAADPGPDAAPEEVEELIDALRRCVRRLRAAKAPIPADLKRAVESFLGGAYEEVLEILAEPLRGSRAVAHASLLSAAARYSISRLDEERRAEMEEAARADVLACRREDPDLRPVPQVFSPLFVEFFDRQQEPPPSEEGPR